MAIFTKAKHIQKKGRRCIPKFNPGQPGPDKNPYQQHPDRSLATISLRSVEKQVCLKPADWETINSGSRNSFNLFFNRSYLINASKHTIPYFQPNI